MNSMDFLTEIQQKMNEDFESQNPEIFDTVFEIEGKKLFAHKYRLSIASSTFKSMLSERWNSKNDAIKIQGYKYEHFKELLTFIYSSKCNLNNSNIFTMIDMAEFYQIDHLKKLCDDFASKMKIDLTNVFEFMGFSSKYSLSQMKKLTENFINENFTNLVKSEEFLKADKHDIHEIVEMELNGIEGEEIFQAVYQWAEYQATEKQSSSINDAIKAEISDFLTYFEFKRMKLTFLHGFVVRRGFLFSYDELSDILENANIGTKCTVKITNSNGKTLSGSLPSDSDAIKIIKSIKNIPSIIPLSNECFWWETEFDEFPLFPSLLKKKDGIEWYLIYFKDGDIGVGNSSRINSDDYLLAEMTADNGEFYVTRNCIIEIC